MLEPRALVRFSMEAFSDLWTCGREGASTMPLKLVVSLGSPVFTEVYAGVGYAIYLRDQFVGVFLNL